MPSGGPKTAVRVPSLREILSATETYTVQRREGFIGSYTITAPSFTVVGEARFYPLTPLAPPREAVTAKQPTAEPTRSDELTRSGSATEETADIGFGAAPALTASDLRRAAERTPPSASSTGEEAQTPMTAVYEIRHAYPHYDVEKGFFEDPLQ